MRNIQLRIELPLLLNEKLEKDFVSQLTSQVSSLIQDLKKKSGYNVVLSGEGEASELFKESLKK